MHQHYLRKGQVSWNIYTAPLVSQWLMATARKQFSRLSDHLCWDIERFWALEKALKQLEVRPTLYYNSKI